MKTDHIFQIYRDRGLELTRSVAPWLAVYEIVCRCPAACGNHALDWNLLNRWVALRAALGAPIRVSSGFRCSQHPLEQTRHAQARPPGQHAQGKALDLVWHAAIPRQQMLARCQEIFHDGGIGIYPWGVHVDVGPPRVWGSL